MKDFQLLNAMDSLYYTLIFDLDKSRQKQNSRKEPFKNSKIPEFGGEMS